MNLLAEPIRFGPEWVKPPPQRNHRNRTFGAQEIHRLLTASRAEMRLWLLLAIQGGYGNKDVALLPREAVDLENGWLHYPRNKTNVDRHTPLWPETTNLLGHHLDAACHPVDDLCFLRPPSNRNSDWTPWHREINGHVRSEVQKYFAGLCDSTGVNHRGRTFYSLRHTFATVGEQCGDTTAVRALMGHKDTSMLGFYCHDVWEPRLLAVTNHVRRWLFGEDVGEESVFPPFPVK